MRLSGPPARQRQQLANAIEELREEVDGSDPVAARVSAIEDALGLGVDATDSARELAIEEGVDLAELDGSGEDGRVLVGDVRDALEGE